MKVLLVGAESEANDWLKHCTDGCRWFFTMCSLGCQRLTFPLEIDGLVSLPPL